MHKFWSYQSPIGKMIRFPLKLLPAKMTLPILSGPLRGYHWLKESGVNGYWLGIYERKQQNLMFRTIRTGDVFFDVGAHVGFYSLLASKASGPAGRVFAFEPVPELIAMLTRHKDINHASNIEIIPAAVAARNGRISFVYGLNTTTGHIGEGGREVPAVSLDEFCRERGLLPDVIKIDVEGAGIGVLEGAAEVLAKKKPAIFFSVHNPEERRSLRALSALGYKFKPLDSEDFDSASEVLASAE